jgi:hypothetical protein
MPTPPLIPDEELHEIGGCLYMLLQRYSSIDKRLIVSVLSQLVEREFRANESR